MRLTLRDNLPFVTARVTYHAKDIEIPDILVDTGSASTILAADMVAPIGIVPQQDDVLHVIHGVGGSEVVFSRKVQRLQVGERDLKRFEIEIGGMDYGFAISGILGMDFLSRAGGIIDLHKLELHFSK